MDRRGRVHLPVARREALLDEFERGGVSAPEFARMAGLKYATFASWRLKRQRRRAASLPAPRAVAVPLFEAVIEPASAPLNGGSGLLVELPGGGRLLITAAGQVPWAAELLRLTGNAGCHSC